MIGDNREVFRELGVVERVVEVLEGSNFRDLTRNATGALANLASENGVFFSLFLSSSLLSTLFNPLISSSSLLPRSSL